MASPRKQPPPADPVSAADVIAFIETVCFVPEGKLVGQPLRLQPWQRDILRAIYDNPAGTRRAIVSLGARTPKRRPAHVFCSRIFAARRRGSGQIRAIFRRAKPRPGCDHLSLPEQDGEAESDLAAQCGSRRPPRRWSATSLGRATGRFRPTRRPLLASSRVLIFDELGRVRGPRSSLFEALESATGAQEDPLSLIISTQAANDSDLLWLLIDDALAGHDQSTVIQLYTAAARSRSVRRSRGPRRQSRFRQFHEPDESGAWRRPPDACRRERRSTVISCLISGSKSRPRSSPPALERPAEATARLAGERVRRSRPLRDRRHDGAGAGPLRSDRRPLAYSPALLASGGAADGKSGERPRPLRSVGRAGIP